MADDDDPKLWLGDCENCASTYTIAEPDLRRAFPESSALIDLGALNASCARCEEFVRLTRQDTVIVKPFSSWMVLSPDHGCQICGTDHEPAMPHDQQSLHYQYWFRSNEGKAGRAERWPTWRDAMAHCEPEVQQGWTDALADRGIGID